MLSKINLIKPADYEIKCMPMSKVVDNNFSEPHLLISICRPELYLKIPENAGRKGIFQTYFSDLESPQVTENCPFNLRDAEQIIDFVDLNKHLAQNIFVHCMFGQSRSPAIALALDRWLNSYKLNAYDQYPGLNRLILKTMLNEIANRNKGEFHYEVDHATARKEIVIYREDLNECLALLELLISKDAKYYDKNVLIFPIFGGIVEVSLMEPKLKVISGKFAINIYSNGNIIINDKYFDTSFIINELNVVDQSNTCVSPYIQHNLLYITRFLKYQLKAIASQVNTVGSVEPAWINKQNIEEFICAFGCYR